jgi:hypothetical protein
MKNTMVILMRVKAKAPNWRAGLTEIRVPMDHVRAAPKAAKSAINNARHFIF